MVEIGNFDASKVAPSEAFDVLPAGWYAARITESEVKESKSGDNMLKLTFELDEARHPKYKGRKVWVNLNLWNQSSPKAQQVIQIAQRDLSAICKAVGIAGVSNTEALHNILLAIKLKVRPASGEYDAANDVCGYDSVMARMPTGGPGGSVPAASGGAAPAAASAQPPWAKK